MNMDQLIDSIHFLSLLVYFIAFILMTQFYIKLRHEKYWVGFPVTLLFFTLHEFFEILNDNYNVQIVIGNINMHTEVLAEIFRVPKSPRGWRRPTGEVQNLIEPEGSSGLFRL